MKVANIQEMIALGRELGQRWLSEIGTNDDAKVTEMAGTRSGAKVIELVGDVGTGKTTLTQGIAEGLGVKETVTSPSFTISKVYALPGRGGAVKDGSKDENAGDMEPSGRLVHYDFYRLPEPGLMAEDLAENLANPQNVVVVEWAGEVDQVLPEERTRVTIKYNDDGSREVEIEELGKEAQKSQKDAAQNDGMNWQNERRFGGKK